MTDDQLNPFYGYITPTANISNEIFVFGSNFKGAHGKGAALEAKKHWGAIRGQAWGLQGRSFAIPTKDWQLQPLPLKSIEQFVQLFLQFVKEHPELTFRMTAIGCGLAGYIPEEIAPFFDDAPQNVKLPDEFIKVLLHNYTESEGK